MKKYHTMALLFLILIYGWFYYQTNYSGPDINDWFRGKSFENNTFSILVNNPEKLIGNEVTFYATLNENSISIYDGINEFSPLIYFNKEQKPISAECDSEYIKVTGTINKTKSDFYFTQIKSIWGYINNKNSVDHGMMFLCYQG